MTEYVYLTRTSRRNEVYHTDESCRHLPEDPTRRSRGPLEKAGYSECSTCQGQGPPRGSTSPDRSHYSTLVAAGASDD